MKKHYPIIMHYPVKRDKVRYLCNQAVSVTPDKITVMRGRVTCKNCLKILRRKAK